ncbi:MAG TPA: HIT domain-containing protein [Spirochaetota bacterium]|jgi:histidine triad (HIT) family protein|nr:HIT domain-containing protein [Spirochaetota bacterium]HOH37336.1 HIT domain-containing protein [Spirochaetota bacterium]HPJ13660.1 HIT domain-containing protein [Spirochaetota bacterium]HPY02063.1 HIT domain-containing protein [Spirochaetota bacterium]HQA53220.1 HIT domain-containing protein [Spirochaetota bacterium]
MDCLFCKIASKEIKSEIVYENANVVAFKDIRPQAAVHLLLIHRTHTENVSSTTSDNSHIFADLFLAAKEIADLQGFAKDGYRIIINSGGCSMQEVYHTHLHILSDKTSLGPLLA